MGIVAVAVAAFSNVIAIVCRAAKWSATLIWPLLLHFFNFLLHEAEGSAFLCMPGAFVRH